MSLQAEEGLESSLNPRKLGLVFESNHPTLGSLPNPPPLGFVIDLMVEDASADLDKMNVDEVAIQSPKANV